MAELTSKREMLLGLKGSQIKFGNQLPSDLSNFQDGDVFINNETWEVYNYDIATKKLVLQGNIESSGQAVAIDRDYLLNEILI